MINSNHYSENLNTIKSITEDRILIPGSIPVKVYIQEAENLYNWCQPDKEKLTANGLDWSLVEDMPARIGALREAQSRWVISDSDDIEVEKQWDVKSPVAHNFRKQLVRAYKFIFRNNAPVISMINTIAEGESNAAMIQSLNDLSNFGRNHIQFLQTTKFDLTLPDKADEMSSEMGSLLAAVNSRRAFCSDTLKIRNQAYTYLRWAVTELKSHANYLFWNDPVKMKGYISGYNRRRNLKKRNRNVVEETENVNL